MIVAQQLTHKRAFFSFLKERWETLFEARFDVLLYDLTSTYFESDPVFSDKRRFGYSRDRRGDCVQVVIALIVTPQGFPLAYEVMPAPTSENDLKDFLRKIETQYGARIGSDHGWGIPTEQSWRRCGCRRREASGQDDELYILAQSRARVLKERAWPAPAEKVAAVQRCRSDA